MYRGESKEFGIRAVKEAKHWKIPPNGLEMDRKIPGAVWLVVLAKSELQDRGETLP